MLVEVEYIFLNQDDKGFTPRRFYKVFAEDVKEYSPEDLKFPTQLYYRPFVGEHILSEDGEFSVTIKSITHKVKQNNKKTILLLSVV